MTIEALVQKEFLKVKPEESISKIVARMKAMKQHAAVIVAQDGSYLGVTDKSKMYNMTKDLQKMNAMHVASMMPALSKDMELAEAAQLLYASNARVLPVMENGKVTGAIFAEHVVAALQKEKAFAGLSAQDIATTTLITVDTSKSIGDAVKLMRNNSVSRIPVVDAAGKLKGILSFRHLLNNHLTLPEERRNFNTFQAYEKIQLSKAPVTEDMIAEVKTASMQERAEAILPLLLTGKGHQVILVEKGIPKGIITIRDLLEAFLSSRPAARNIQLEHVPALDEVDKAVVDKKIGDFYERMERMLGKDIAFSIHVKTVQGTGVKKKYEVNAKLIPKKGLGFHAMETGWKLLTAIQDAVDTLESEVRRKKR